jgi:hypothetical protein
MDTACSGWYGVEGCSNQDPYNLKLDRSVSGFDLTHVFAVNWLYELPFGKGKLSTGNSIADYLLGNWQFNGIVQLHSGLPYTVGVTGDIANTGNSNCCSGFYERLNLVGDPSGKNDASEWLNPSAFAAPAPFIFGNLGRNIFRTDWYKNVDISLFRQFPISEVARLELRAEAFNVLNVTTYAQPVNNFSSVNFGQVQSIGSNPRQLQLALKITF